VLISLFLLTQSTLMKLKSAKAPGIDEIPNDFLKFGGDIMIRSLVDMFTAISDIEVIPPRLA
jgi:hypothetical protein